MDLVPSAVDPPTALAALTAATQQLQSAREGPAREAARHEFEQLLGGRAAAEDFATRVTAHQLPPWAQLSLQRLLSTLDALLARSATVLLRRSGYSPYDAGYLSGGTLSRDFISWRPQQGEALEAAHGSSAKAAFNSTLDMLLDSGQSGASLLRYLHNARTAASSNGLAFASAATRVNTSLDGVIRVATKTCSATVAYGPDHFTITKNGISMTGAEQAAGLMQAARGEGGAEVLAKFSPQQPVGARCWLEGAVAAGASLADRVFARIKDDEELWPPRDAAGEPLSEAERQQHAATVQEAFGLADKQRGATLTASIAKRKLEAAASAAGDGKRRRTPKRTWE